MAQASVCRFAVESLKPTRDASGRRAPARTRAAPSTSCSRPTDRSHVECSATSLKLCTVHLIVDSSEKVQYFEPTKILIVDDNPKNRAICEEIFEEDFDLIHAEDGRRPCN